MRAIILSSSPCHSNSTTIRSNRTWITVPKTMTMATSNNTITMALNQEGLTGKFRVLHLQMFDEEIMQAAETALGISGEQMTQFQQQSEFLAKQRATKEQVDNFIAELFQPKLLIERAKSNEANLPPLHEEFTKTSQSILEAIETSPGHDMSSAKGTWWGALNGVTYVMDHQKRAKTRDHALNSAWFGNNAQVKRKAMAKALEYAKAA